MTADGQADQQPATRAHVEIVVETGRPLTIGHLRDFVARCETKGLDDTAEPTVRVFFSGKAKKIVVKGEADG